MNNDSGVVWIRVSTEEQARAGFSQAQQERVLVQAAKDRGIRIKQKWVVAESAKTAETRKRFKELVEFIKEHGTEWLLAWSVDRIARNYRDFYTIQELIDDGLQIFIADGNRVYSKSASVEDRFMFRLMGNLAQRESELTSRRTSFGMRGKLQEGRLPGEAPIGYFNVADPEDSSGKKRTVKIDDERAPFVVSAFELYDSGDYTINTLRDEMNRRGLTNKPGPSRPRRPITKSQMQRILTNAFYFGELHRKGEVFPGKHQPLISRELYYRVQNRMHENLKGRRNRTQWFLYKPFLYCGYCHRAVLGERHEKYIYYSCSGQHNRTEGKKECDQGRFWKEAEINALVLEEMGDLYVNDQIISTVRDYLRTASLTEETFNRAELRRLQKAETEKVRQVNYPRGLPRG